MKKISLLFLILFFPSICFAGAGFIYNPAGGGATGPTGPTGAAGGAGQSTISSANNLTLGVNPEQIVSGTTTINAITTSGWAAGNRVSLIFQGILTVKNNTAGGAGTAKILLDGGNDIVTKANTVLGLEYDGTQWQQTYFKAGG